MKLRSAADDDIVTVRFGSELSALAEARELKTAGFGGRDGTRDYPGEWTLLAVSLKDFKLLASAIPVRWRVFKPAPR